MSSRAEWLRNAGWGVFVHYLADGASNQSSEIDMTPDQWNRQVDNFNVKGFADQLEEVGAGYLFFTLGQCSGYFCTPNKTYDELVQRDPSRLSRRDLIQDLADELTGRGIRMMAYLPSHAPALDLQAVVNLGCTPEWDASCWSGLKRESYTPIEEIDERLTIFQRNWEKIITEWSTRWGDKVSGWWLDGCYKGDIMYRHSDAPNFSSFGAALRSGNPESIIAFNSGVKTPIISECEEEDYTAGEIADNFPVPTKWGNLLSKINDKQYHVLTFMAPYWGAGDQPRMSDAFAAGYTEHVNSVGGAITWDIPVSRTGKSQNRFSGS